MSCTESLTRSSDVQHELQNSREKLRVTIHEDTALLWVPSQGGLKLDTRFQFSFTNTNTICALPETSQTAPANT